MRKNSLTILTLVLVSALALAGCGSKDVAETTAGTTVSAEVVSDAPLALSEWTLSTTTWSSPNGATVNLTAIPVAYEDGQSATFVVRLENEDVANIPCEWDGKTYTAAAELNAADGLYYYVTMTAADGTVSEIPVNTPDMTTSDSFLINLESALNSYCNIIVEDSSFSDGKLVLAQGIVEVQAPKITNDGEEITASEAVLVLSTEGQQISSETVELKATEAVGNYEADLIDLTFKLPDLENDQQLVLTLNVTLSNDQVLTANGGTFFYMDGDMLTAVG